MVAAISLWELNGESLPILRDNGAVNVGREPLSANTIRDAADADQWFRRYSGPTTTLKGPSFVLDTAALLSHTIVSN